jgi:hypothetical protein
MRILTYPPFRIIKVSKISLGKPLMVNSTFLTLQLYRLIQLATLTLLYSMVNRRNKCFFQNRVFLNQESLKASQARNPHTLKSFHVNMSKLKIMSIQGLGLGDFQGDKKEITMPILNL